MTGREILAKIRNVVGGGSIEEYLENELSDIFDNALLLVKDFEDGGEECSEEGHADCLAFLKEIVNGLQEDGKSEVNDGKH